MSDRIILWQGLVDDKLTRVRSLSENDCMVEIEDFGETDPEKATTWTPSDDEHAMNTYMSAFLEHRSALRLLLIRTLGEANRDQAEKSLVEAKRLVGDSLDVQD